MSDPLDKITEGKDLLGKIKNTVSGFLGYFDRENRREADKFLREQIASRYEEQWGRVSKLQRDLISAGQIQYLDDLEEGAIKLRIFADRVRRAAYGYAGFFDAVRVHSEELERIYAFDNALLENVDALASAIDNIEASIETDGLPAAIRHMVTLSQEANDALARRKDVILELNVSQ
jgi:hypothetical protein